MALKYVSDCVELLLKLTPFLIIVFSTPSPKQCTTKETEMDDYVIRNVGIKLCKLKCSENGQCLSIEYDIETLTCRLSRVESKKIEKKEGQVILARDHLHVPMGSCTSDMCSFGQRCLETRSGKAVCVQDKKNDPDKSQHKFDKQGTFAKNQLREACRNGDLNRVTDILSQGVNDINGRDEQHGMTALMVAAQEGRCKIFNFLISKGANISDVDNDCKNVLHWTCKGGHAGMRECVLPQYGIVKNVALSPLLQAAKMGNRDVFEFLECMRSTESQENNRNLALHFASMGGHVALVKYLVSQGSVDIKSRRRDGRTALMEAAFGGHTDIFEFLVSMGANVSRVDGIGNNVLHFASMSGHIAMVKYLVSQGSVDVKSRRIDGMTPLMAATFGGGTDVFEFLVSRGANASRVDDIGNNVLHYACMGGHMAMVKYLTSRGSVDIKSRRIDGRTALMEAAVHGHKDVFDFLVNIGANASRVDDKGRNVLHLASSDGNVNMVKHILSKNLVDINARDTDEKTAAMIAKRKRKRHVYNLLVLQGCHVK